MLSRRISKSQESVLNLLMAGKSQKEIAAALNISESTVRFHTSALFRLWNVSDKANLILALVKDGYFATKPVIGQGLPQGRAQW